MKKVISLILVVIFVAGCLVGCGNKQVEDDDVLVVYGNNKVLNDVTDNLTWMQEELGFKIKYITVGGSEYNSKLNLMIGSGDVPDVMLLDETTYYDYLDQGLLMEIEDLLRKYAPNVFKYRTEEQMDNIRYYEDGKLYAVANTINPGYTMHLIRKDWLENLGLDEPETLEEYTEVMRAFTFDDPDGNGIDDTYGFGGSGGFENVFANFFPCFGGNASQWVMKDGKIVLGTVQDEAKECIKYLRQMYKEGVIDPEYLVSDSTLKKKKIVEGKWGMWADQLWYADTKENVTYAGEGIELTCVHAPVDENGRGGYISNNVYASMYTVISSSCKHPDRATKLLNFLAEPENYERIRTGLEGVHWEYDENGAQRDTEAVKNDPTMKTSFGIAPTYAMPFMPYDILNPIEPSKTWLEMRRSREEDYYAATYATAPEIQDQMLGVGYRDAFKRYCNKMIMEETDIDATFEEMKKDLYDNYDLGEIERLQTEHYKKTTAAIEKYKKSK